MSVTPTPVFPQTIKNGVVQIQNSDASNLKTIYTAGTNGSAVENLTVSSTDTASRDLQLSFLVGGTTYILGTLSIPANSGFTNAVPSVAILFSTQFPHMSVDANGNCYLYLASGTTLQAKTLTTVTTAKIISIICQAGDY